MKHPYWGVFIVILSFIALTVFLTALNLTKITSAGFLTKTINQSSIYNQMPEIADKIVIENKLATDQAIIYRIVGATLEPAYVQDQISANLPRLIDFLRGNAAAEFSLNLKPFKDNLANKSPGDFEEAVEKSITNMPVCSINAEVKTDQLPTCRPADKTTEVMAEEIAKSFQSEEFLKQVPDTLNLGQQLAPKTETFAAVQKSFQILRLVLIISVLISLILLGILAYLARSSWIYVLRWLGFALMLPAAFHLALVIVGRGSLESGISACIAKTTPLAAHILEPVVLVFAKNIFHTNLLYAGIMFFAGLIGVVTSYLLHTRKGEPDVR